MEHPIQRLWRQVTVTLELLAAHLIALQRVLQAVFFNLFKLS